MSEAPNCVLEKFLDSRWSDPNAYGFSLSSGRNVIMDAFHLEETYAGLIEGVTTEADNDARIERKMHGMEKVWGQRATYLIKSASRLFPGPNTRPNIRLPRYCYHAWLLSKEMNKGFAGSELVVIWFGRQEKELSLLGMVEHACRDVPWEKHARDFDY